MSDEATLFWITATLIGIGYLAGYLTARLREETRVKVTIKADRLPHDVAAEVKQAMDRARNRGQM